MSEGIDYYATLGLDRAATTKQIKQAYRSKAKTSHPDSGGSVPAMARINAAYHVLGDAHRRHEYDGRSAPAPVGAHRSAREPFASSPAPTRPQTTWEPHPAHEPSSEYAEAQHINRERTMWARASAWELARISGPVAVAVIIVTRFISGTALNSASREAAGLFAFIPVYALALSIVFLISPHVRLIYADLARRHHTTWHERVTALALVLAFVPLSLIWVAMFYTP